ncbi:putative two-component system response regulator [Oribacterium sp. KHPX15]|uniref:HD domain-containing phosphohydrolase n=1 Tax=Oribacterium sp. KHPX15 TaxID=1855342 RepID=UPI000895C6AA|nr:HD domain-containing phosphohydrolase [Oribacterium sp. KHPX15]SEA31270.1 putative two-component system response regulator [Oribacterium sp. KHPX15]
MEERVVIVDDDAIILKSAKTVLSEAGFKVTCLKSGRLLLDYVEKNTIDMLLLDIKMPDLDGFETLKLLRLWEKENSRKEIPVIFFTADDDCHSETIGLSMGAMDFIRKPFVAEVLTLRVRHLLDLIRLQRDLHAEVEKKTREIEGLSIHIVQTLAEAIDAKDTYTKGHSSRVAEYSREIARRAGYTTEKQEEIYMMGLLHDVGKIGVPNAVINKPGRLTDEEYDIIKTHPGRGAKILQNIEEMPKLAIGARCHHERYDGRGYPDGISGEDIPEETRIIAVADAYDAMTSNRSYRGVLPQDVVRSEVEKGSGTQFDPKFAAIMLEIIKEDVDFKLHE